MNRQEIIKKKLSVLEPEYLKVIDNSCFHKKHNIDWFNTQSHFTIKIFANSISSYKILSQHKIIKDLLKDEFENGLHALSIIIIKNYTNVYSYESKRHN